MTLIIVAIALVGVILFLQGCEPFYPLPDDPFLQQQDSQSTTSGANTNGGSGDTGNNDQSGGFGSVGNTGGTGGGSYGAFTGPDVPTDQVLDDNRGPGFRVNGQAIEPPRYFKRLTGSDLSGGGVSGVVGVQTRVSSDYTSLPGYWTLSAHMLGFYQHFYQNDAKPEYPGSTLCGPTCYMMASHMVGMANNYATPVTKTYLGQIYSRLKQAGKFWDTQGMYISDIPWYAGAYDQYFFSVTSARTQDRSSMKGFIEQNIQDGFPVIVTVNIYATAGLGNDVDNVNKSGKIYYIDPSSRVGHFILLVAVKINNDGSGMVYYRDPLSKDGATRVVNYTRLLDSMKANGNVYYYDAVAVRSLIPWNIVV